MSIAISISSENRKESVETLALIDSGAEGMFIDQNYAKNFKIQKLDKPLMALNVDGTPNKKGKITSFVDLNIEVNNQQMKVRLLVAGLGKQKIIFGFPWLNEYNPNIDWKTGNFTWREANKRQMARKLA
jgi:hypothetical protein